MSHKRKAKWVRRKMIIAAQYERFANYTPADYNKIVTMLVDVVRDACAQMSRVMPMIIGGLAKMAIEIQQDFAVLNMDISSPGVEK